MKCSVALATCNGSKFLLEQLESLLHQTLLPDELVVCDDASEDDTLDIIRRFAERASFQVVIKRNETRVGVKRNFSDALASCAGDIIFICDQDDYWSPTKIERVYREFAENPGTHAVATDALICDVGLNSSGLTVAATAGPRNGSCNAYSQEFLKFALPVPPTPTSYDGWLYSLSSWMNVRRDIAEVHQHWRRHDTAVSGWKEVKSGSTLPYSGQFMRLERLVKTVRAGRRRRILERELVNLTLLCERTAQWLDAHDEGHSLFEPVKQVRNTIGSRLLVAEFRLGLLQVSPARRFLRAATAFLMNSFDGQYSARTALIDVLTRADIESSS